MKTSLECNRRKTYDVTGVCSTPKRVLVNYRNITRDFHFFIFFSWFNPVFSEATIAYSLEKSDSANERYTEIDLL